MENSQFPLIEVFPNPSKLDEKVKIIVKDLVCGNPYTLYSCTSTSKNGDRFECLAHYKASSQGDIDISVQPSEGGFYKGIEPMALVWELRSSSKTKNQRPIRHEHAVDIILKVFNGFLPLDDAIANNGKKKPQAVAEILINRHGGRLNRRKQSVKDIDFVAPSVLRSVSDITSNSSTSNNELNIARPRLFSTEF